MKKFFKNNKGFVVKSDDGNEDIAFGESAQSPHAFTADEISFLGMDDSDDEFFYDSQNHSPLEMLKGRMQHTTNTQPANENMPDDKKETDKSSEDENRYTPSTSTQSLLERLSRYTVDEQGNDLSKANLPLYQLESVAEILESNSEKTLQALSKKYSISIDKLGKDTEVVKKETPSKITEKNCEETSSGNRTPSFEKMVSDARAREEQLIFDELFPSDKNSSIPDISIPDISDIDNNAADRPQISDKATYSTETIRFTPIKDSKGNTDHISITRIIDTEGDSPTDISNNNITASTELEKTDFEMFSPSDEITDLSSGKKLLRKLAIKKRNGFLRTLISTMMALVISVFALPSVYDNIIKNPRSSMIICGVLLLISVLANSDMFLDFGKLFKKECSSDVIAAPTAIITLVLTVFAAATHSDAYYTILMCSLILFFRSLFAYKETSATLGNLRQIVNSKPKKAINLIGNTTATFAMARGAIEGDALIAAPRNTNFVKDFMKYSQFSKKLSGKTHLIFYVSVILAITSGLLAFFYYDGIFISLYCAASILCLAALPTLFLIDSLPVSSAAKKLNAMGGMIAGVAGAQRLECSNAVVISTNDIFPSGTITMKSMKVICDNNIDDTLLRAASLTEAISSPLSHIFKKIAKTNTTYSIPDSDTVKYEKRLGISGWVNDELLFIGNRSLMKAHGIDIPNVEVDKKILRRGYFPVYVATAEKACALIVIQYDVDRAVAKELRKITELGITLLVNNCDPNVNEEMICDYFGLYDDSVKIMSNAGVQMFKNATLPCEHCSAPAAFRGTSLSFITIMNCASRIRKSNILLTVIYTISTILSVLYFVYTAFAGFAAIPTSSTILIFEIAITVISLILYLIKKP